LSVDYNETLLTNRLQVVANAIDAGPGGGRMRLLDEAGNVLSSMPLFVPCGVVASGVLNFTVPLVDPAAMMGGGAATARVEDANGTVVISGLTINTTNADIHLTPTNVVNAGQTVSITAASITGN
jgi:hypothetical protein